MTIPSQIPLAMPPPVHSNFVTVLAWIFIVLSGFATAMSAMQNIVISNMPFDQIEAQMQQAPNNAPMFARLMFSHMRGLFLVFLVMSAVTLAAAIGLLKRRNWARLLFIADMVLGILWNIGGLALQFVMLSSFPAMMDGGSADMPTGFTGIMIAMMGFSLVVAIGFTILYGWIIKRLTSPDIRREFGAL